MNVVDLERDYHYAYCGYLARNILSSTGPLLYRFLDFNEFAFSERIVNTLHHIIYHDTKSD
jgi:hypothetical protein